MLDFRELKQFVEFYLGDDVIDICEIIRELRQISVDLRNVYFKSAYLQTKISKDLWKY